MHASALVLYWPPACLREPVCVATSSSLLLPLCLCQAFDNPVAYWGKARLLTALEILRTALQIAEKQEEVRAACPIPSPLAYSP